ncbi:MAG: PRC-barrel domain-containing protein [Marinobacter sp.]|uniref:PRC-barrel domain-containing protein n=1 Tax=Marinobacter sp. TaxID=50741 RepID=UPI00396D4BF6
MNKLHSFAFYALITPAIALGSSSALAQQSTGSQVEQTQPGMQKNQGDMKSSTKAPQTAQSPMQNTGYMGTAPANSIHASNLIGAEVISAGDEKVGAVSDLIIDQNGQVVGFVIGVGGFLGMGEKDVAIGWDDVQKSDNADELELRIDQSRESLLNAPEFKTQK